MLELIRKKNESIVIDNVITVTVVGVGGDKVLLGVVAPKEVPIRARSPVVCGAHEKAFLKAIFEGYDKTVPLIYADWLEERGDPRAEFIRLQFELATLGPEDERRKGLQEREQHLWYEQREDWRSYLKALGLARNQNVEEVLRVLRTLATADGSE
jgi:uncharacterized protein (TIGR02996 family)